MQGRLSSLGHSLCCGAQSEEAIIIVDHPPLNKAAALWVCNVLKGAKLFHIRDKRTALTEPAFQNGLISKGRLELHVIVQPSSGPKRQLLLWLCCLALPTFLLALRIYPGVPSSSVPRRNAHMVLFEGCFECSISAISLLPRSQTPEFQINRSKKFGSPISLLPSG